MKITDEKELRKIANDVRIDIINEVYSAKSGHPGGALSIADILTVLYFNQMNVNPEMPESNLRDRLVLSKGHASAALYAVLAERGFKNLESNLKAQNLQLDAEDKKAIAALDCNDRLVSPEGLAPEWD